MRLLIVALALVLVAPAQSKVKRSYAAKAAFARSMPCPSTGERRLPCPGYVIDHMVPLACGGPDHPDNMAWQAIATARRKDAWERDHCVCPKPAGAPA